MGTLRTLESKRVLLLSSAFFGYEYLMKSKMEEMGAKVDYFDERSVTKAFDRALLKVSPNIFNNKTEKYYDNIISVIKENNYDNILIFNCYMMTPKILDKFHEIFPKVKFCLYLCDAIQNIKGITSKFQYFDKIYSFDLDDTRLHRNIIFQPLFYADCYRKEVNDTDNYNYDISFIGTIHSDRYAIIKNVKSICKQYNKKSFLYNYLQSDFIYYYYKLRKAEFRNTKKSEFTTKKMSSSDIAKIVDESRVILDIQHPRQTGLTMRTIEMLGMNKKLITTNESIKEYDFYNPNNILVIKRSNIVIPESFFCTPYERVQDDIYKKYSLESWMSVVLS